MVLIPFLKNNFEFFLRKRKKGGFRENKSLKSRLKTPGSVVQVLRAKENIFLFALEKRGYEKPQKPHDFWGFRCNIFFGCTTWHVAPKKIFCCIALVGRKAPNPDERCGIMVSFYRVDFLACVQ